MELEKTEQGNRAFHIAIQGANFIISRVVHVPFVLSIEPYEEPQEPTQEEPNYEQMLLNYAEVDDNSRRWDVV